jgi:NitT/TauT family transport system permease protein
VSPGQDPDLAPFEGYGWWPLAGIALALVAIFTSRRLAKPVQMVLLPASVALIGLMIWQLSCDLSGTKIFPTPEQTAAGMMQLLRDGTLWRYIVASLYRVTWGFVLAGAVGIPLGLWAGWSSRSFQAVNPLIQGLRPISPIAWIPIAILWFGVGDGAAIFLIFLSSFFPIVVGTMAAVRNISLVHVRSAQNFGLEGFQLFRRVVLPASLPQIITGLRIALGVAWLVVVAAEMIAVNSGLGYLINDARNMGMRYDLVVAGMLVIGAIGIVLDLMIRRLERFDEVRWGYARG